MAASVRGVTTKFGGVFSPLKTAAAARNYFTYTNEPSQPIKGKEPKWTTSDEAFQDLKSGKQYNNHYINILASLRTRSDNIPI